jgi:hypothetical protein
MKDTMFLMGDCHLRPLSLAVFNVANDYDHEYRYNLIENGEIEAFLSVSNQTKMLNIYSKPSKAYSIKLDNEKFKEFNSDKVSMLFMWGYSDIFDYKKNRSLKPAVDNYLNQITFNFNLTDITLAYPIRMWKFWNGEQSDIYEEWCDLLTSKAKELGLKKPMNIFDKKYDDIFANKDNYDLDHLKWWVYYDVWFDILNNFIDLPNTKTIQ